MKNFWILLFSLLISSLVFVSCEDDTDDGNDPDAPQITLTGGDQEVAPGTFADYTLSILPGRSDLQSYRVLVDGLEADVTDFMIDGAAPISNPILLEGTDDEDGFNTSISFLAPDNSGASFEYEVEATDTRDRVSTSQLVTVSTASQDLIFEFSQEPGENFYEVMADAGILRSVDFNAQAGNAPLASIEITRGGVIVDDTDLLFQGAPGSNPFTLTDQLRDAFTDFGIAFRAPATGGESFEYTVTLTDENNVEKNLLLTVTAVSTLDGPFNGQFYHMDGASGCTGGYDLVNDADVSAAGSDANRDMLNTDVAPNPFTGSWMAQNGTRYVDATAFIDDLDVNKGNAESLFASGTETASINNPQVGNFYVAQLRGGSDYAVIRIDRVDAADNSCNASTNNTGIIEFTYVKG
ncbi:MAG TPA: hypothetical protein VJ917_07930 [Saprospiraceae bacterium]|nr:hypothetical protein [Saprospiraceae bacterium]